MAALRPIIERNKGFQMSKPLGLVSLLLMSSAMVAPVAALGQTVPTTPDASTPPAEALPVEEAPQEATDVSIPGGGEIVVTGRRNANISRVAPEVVAVLSSADIARTGEGNIAGALGRVTDRKSVV